MVIASVSEAAFPAPAWPALCPASSGRHSSHSHGITARNCLSSARTLPAWKMEWSPSYCERQPLERRVDVAALEGRMALDGGHAAVLRPRVACSSSELVEGSRS